jgi:hypothetical protein
MGASKLKRSAFNSVSVDELPLPLQQLEFGGLGACAQQPFALLLNAGRLDPAGGLGTKVREDGTQLLRERIAGANNAPLHVLGDGGLADAEQRSEFTLLADSIHIPHWT